MEKKILLFNVNPSGKLVDYCPLNSDFLSGRPTDHIHDIYLNEQVSCALQGAYIPDERIYRLELPENQWTEGTPLHIARQWAEDPNQLGKISSFSLREVVYAYETTPKELHTASKLLSTLYDNLINPDKRRRLDAYDQYHHQREMNYQNRPLTGIATDGKLLYFDDTGRGLRCMQAYLQHLADHYFDPSNENLKALSYYYFTSSDKEIINLARNYSMMFDPPTPGKDSSRMPEFKSAVAVYDDIARLKEFRSTIELSMGPNQEHYQNFLREFNLSHSYPNENIAYLIHITEKGLTDKYPDFFNNDFSHRDSFRGIEERLKVFSETRGPGSPKEILQGQAKEVARRILSTEYRVRGFPHLEIKVEQTNKTQQTNKPKVKIPHR